MLVLMWGPAVWLFGQQAIGQNTLPEWRKQGREYWSVTLTWILLLPGWLLRGWFRGRRGRSTAFSGRRPLRTHLFVRKAQWEIDHHVIRIQIFGELQFVMRGGRIEENYASFGLRGSNFPDHPEPVGNARAVRQFTIRLAGVVYERHRRDRNVIIIAAGNGQLYSVETVLGNARIVRIFAEPCENLSVDYRVRQLIDRRFFASLVNLCLTPT